MTCDRECRVCRAPCRNGEVEHGKGCYHVLEEGGGVEACDCRRDHMKDLGTLCSVCCEPQYETGGGACCKNGHGGADPIQMRDQSRPLSYRQVVAVTMKMHAAMMVLGADSPEVQRIRTQLGGHPERLSEDQQASLRELGDWLVEYAERNGLS